MSHSEFIREVPGSRNAVVLIHGILGTPRHFDDLVPLIPHDWSVYNILLDGHGGTVRDFSHTSMKKWRSQVTARLDKILPHYHRIILVAHSMGTLFSIQEAIRRPEKISYLFMLQTPLRPWLSLRAVCCSILLPFGVVLRAAEDMKKDCGVDLNPRLWEYLGWIPRFAELLQECSRTRKILSQLTVPVHFYQSRRDELVSTRTCKDLQKHPHLHFTVLPNSGHFGYHGDDLKLLQTEFRKLF